MSEPQYDEAAFRIHFTKGRSRIQKSRIQGQPRSLTERGSDRRIQKAETRLLDNPDHTKKGSSPRGLSRDQKCSPGHTQ